MATKPKVHAFTILILAIIAIGAGCHTASAANGDSAMPQTKHFFVRLLGTRPDWPNNMTPAEEKIMDDHFAYLKALVAKKKVLVAGPCFDPVFGLMILQVESDSEAVAIMKEEPSNKTGLMTYQMQPLRLSLFAHHIPKDRYALDPSDKNLHKEMTVHATPAEVWKAWTTNDGLTSFFAPGANVELRPGGLFEIFFNMAIPYGSRGSEDCRILSYLPEKMFSFEWNAPPQFGPLRVIHTQVILLFSPVGSDSTKVEFSQIGWGKGEEWDKLYTYFDRAWSFVLDNLKKRFDTGPIDMSK
jgi:uncharacterized protein YndB with AHSA1/START domain/uncharacterized protein YciI